MAFELTLLIILLLALFVYADRFLFRSAKETGMSQILEYAVHLTITDKNLRLAMFLIRLQLFFTPGHPMALHMLAYAYMKQDKFTKALKYGQKALRCNNPPMEGVYDSKILSMLASINVELENMEEAAVLYESALEQVAKEGGEDEILISEDYADVLVRLGRFVEAETVYRHILDNGPSLCALVGMGFLLTERGDMEEALDLLDSAEELASMAEDEVSLERVYRYRMEAHHFLGHVEQSIDDALAWYHLYEEADVDIVRSVAGQKKEYAASRIAQRIDEGEAPARWKLLLALMYEYCGDYEICLNLLDKLEAEHGEAVNVFIGRSECFYELGMTEEALEQVDKAISLADCYNTRSMKLMALLAAGRFKEVIHEAGMLTGTAPDVVFAYALKGQCLEYMNKPEKALEAYDDGVLHAPHDAYIHLLRGRVLAALGKSDEARADFEAVVSLDMKPGRGSCKQWALHMLGRDEEAEAWMAEVMRASLHPAEVTYAKATLLAAMGRCEEALEALERALELGHCEFSCIRLDPDMAGLRERRDFAELIDRYEMRMRERAESLRNSRLGVHR